MFYLPYITISGSDEYVSFPCLKSHVKEKEGNAKIFQVETWHSKKNIGYDFGIVVLSMFYLL